MTQENAIPDIAKMQRLIARTIKASVVINLIFGFGYLIMLNGLATQGFDLETLKAERISLQKELDVTDISLAIPSSIYALESNELIQEMPLVLRKQFLEIYGGEVALLEN